MKRILSLFLVLASLLSIVGCSKAPATDPAATNPTAPATNSEAAAPATPEQVKKLTVQKTASAGGALTLHPGSDLTYTVTITNNNDKAVSLDVTDTLPENTTLVDGCETVNGSALTWKLDSLGPGETTAISYTVKNNYTLKGIREAKDDTLLEKTAVKVMGTEVATTDKDIYVLETFNKEDIRKLSMAIDAMVNANLTAKNSSNKPMCEISLLSMIYTVAFSSSTNFGSTDTAEVLNMIFENATKDTVENNGGAEDVVEKATNLLLRVAPTLYGGTKVGAEKDKLFRGARATSVTIDDLVTGDAIFAEANGEIKLYVVDGQHLVHLGKTEITRKIDPATVLPNLPKCDRYVVVRPSIDLNITFSLQEGEYYNEADKLGYSDTEKALIATAESYLLRGDRFQYTDDQTSKDTFRWQSATRQPEDCTVDQYGYSNCAAFVYDVHWATLGLKATGNSKSLNVTKHNAAFAKKYWNMETGTSSAKSVVFYAEPMKKVGDTYEATLDDAGKAALKEKIVSVLRPGDIINIRRTTGSGHAMLYVGNGTIIHSAGSNYSTKYHTDTHEATARFRMVEDLFDPAVYNETSCIYNLESVSILRLQHQSKTGVTENAANRVANMQGIIAEKVSSTAMGKTINCGETVTYSFYIFNTTDEDKQIPIRDEVAPAATFVSATDGGTCTDGVIAWDLTVPADSRICVSYTVKANENLSSNVKLDGAKATIGGVTHKCFDTVVANTLTAEQQQTLVEAVNTVKEKNVSSLTSPEIASLIYETAFGTKNIFGEQVKTFGQLLDGEGEPHVGVFLNATGSTNLPTLSLSDVNKSPACLMVAPGLIGGAKVSGNSATSPFYRYQDLVDTPLRSRYFWEKDLVVGDLFLMKSADKECLYIYTGDNTFVSLNPADKFATESVSKLFEGAPNNQIWMYTAVLRPSLALDI